MAWKGRDGYRPAGLSSRWRCPVFIESRWEYINWKLVVEKQLEFFQLENHLKLISLIFIYLLMVLINIQ